LRRAGIELVEGRLANDKVRILSLDGGGAKGFYTLGALREIEALAGGVPLHKQFRLVFGTSTGSIIAALIAQGYKVEDIYKLYSKHVPKIMGHFLPGAKTRALQAAADEVFKKEGFDAFKSGIDVGIVATNYDTETPMIFKTSSDQAYTMKESFVPGFGCTISDAVQASCSAYPFFKRKKVTTAKGDTIELIDGGYCANNPTLYAIAEALVALKLRPENLRVVSVGVGMYPEPRRKPLNTGWWLNKFPGARFFQKTLEINTQSMDQLQRVLYSHVATVRINQRYTKPEMATDLLERDLTKLGLLRTRGAECVRDHQAQLKEFFS
jgi:predicted acylesterase/phospholipase RssA